MASVYEIVTSEIIKRLEEGTIPWSKPWQCMNKINYVTRKPYRGVNLWLLPKDGEYMTFKQCQELGGKVKKGAKSHMVVFWNMLEKEEQEKDKKELIPMLRYYRVFHLSDIEGIESKIEIVENKHNLIEEAELIIGTYPNAPKIEIKESDRAYYSPMFDKVVVPKIEQYKKAEEYYSTFFHELIHSTGHESRLKRFKPEEKLAAFGSEEYSKEELIAELGASMLCGLVGIENRTIDNSAAYIQSWLNVLKGDNRMIISASSNAQKAVEYIIG